MTAMLAATIPASSQKPSGNGRRNAAPVAQPGSRYATDQPAAATTLTAANRGNGISPIPATIRRLTVNGTVMRADVDVGALLEVHLTPLSSDELGLRPGSDVWLVIKTHSCRPVSAV